jgi:hypothetical protein
MRVGRNPRNLAHLRIPPCSPSAGDLVPTGGARGAGTRPRGRGLSAVAAGRGHLVSRCAPPSRLTHRPVGQLRQRFLLHRI